MDLPSLSDQLSSLLDLPELNTPRKSQTSVIISSLKQVLSEANLILHDEFRHNTTDINTLVTVRAYWIDAVLTKAWHYFDLDQIKLTLVAVGGYGRAELHPQSDIDILILAQDESPFSAHASQVESFIQLLWDIGLKVGQSVRTIQECVDEASNDLTIITNLMESRTIVGCDELTTIMQDTTGPEHLWPSTEFLKGKRQEQLERHLKFKDIEYNLEPNIKSSPGGLRDYQTLSWIARRHYGDSSLESLIKHKVVSTAEAAILRNGLTFLWKLRYALHLVADRPEDSLLFDYQQPVAELMEYQDIDDQLAIEQMMQDYYRVTTALSELRDLLSQHLSELIVESQQKPVITSINERFQIKNDRIEVIDRRLFQKNTTAILEIFLLMAQNPNILGARAKTIRLMRENRHLIDESFRQDPKNTQLFIDIINTNNAIIPEIIRMARYGILGRYLPEYGSIIGLMQHDLFHAYTVDAHTLQNIRMIHKLYHEPNQGKFPLASKVIQTIPNINLLYIAALLHDTGMSKGNHKFHADTGAKICIEFCKRHNLSREDRNLVTWIVRHHQLMSHTAQRKDISDPEEVQRFVAKVRDKTHLNYLYIFTVADINATNPTLWTSWRASLLTQLHSNTNRLLERGDQQNQSHRQEWIEETRRQALTLLLEEGLTLEEVHSLWIQNTEDYFLRESPESIAWHTKALKEHKKENGPLVLIKEDGGDKYAGGTQIFICTTDRPGLFTLICATLDRLNLSVQDARILPTVNEYTYDTYVVLGENGRPIHDAPERIQVIKQELIKVIANPEIKPPKIHRRTSRQLKHFTSPTKVMVSSDCSRRYTIIEIIAPDRPGLLALVGSILLENNVIPHSARILTLGEKVEDLFYVTDLNGEPVENPELCLELQAQLCEGIDEFVQNKTH